MTGWVVTRFAKGAVFALLALASTGCFASLSQLDEVNEQVALNRSEAAASDSVRAVQIVEVLRTLRALNDSIAALNLRITRLRAETQAEVRTMRQEVNQVLEVTGQSERRIRELRDQIDRRSQQSATTQPAGTNGDTTGVAETTTGPDAAELLQIGRGQLTRGANSAARAALTDLLTRFPNSEYAAEAQFLLAEAHAAEGSTAAADSAYSIVVTKYPSSTRAATSLYKRGVLAQTAGRRTAARRLFNQLIDQYADSDEADLARERLRVMN
jgi:tol-pal system protein YbgF